MALEDILSPMSLLTSEVPDAGTDLLDGLYDRVVFELPDAATELLDSLSPSVSVHELPAVTQGSGTATGTGSGVAFAFGVEVADGGDADGVGTAAGEGVGVSFADGEAEGVGSATAGGQVWPVAVPERSVVVRKEGRHVAVLDVANFFVDPEQREVVVDIEVREVTA